MYFSIQVLPIDLPHRSPLSTVTPEFANGGKPNRPVTRLRGTLLKVCLPPSGHVYIY